MIKNLLMLLSLILLPLNLALAKEIKVNPEAPSYHNARFGFSLSWPKGEYKIFEAENGDGITITDAQGLTFKAYGALDPRIEDNPLNAFFAKADKPAVYKKINRKQKWYVRS
ncbi:MAG: hypothetical protein IJU40_08480, partial [Desulfovibrionaceae bacterium]|nr:hypothetical protein [Desulfovibrionaceae bacterium]